MFCRRCNRKFDNPVIYCPYCGLKLVNTKNQKSAWVASLLSFVVPGTGQLYAGNIKRALGFFFGLFALTQISQDLSEPNIFLCLVTVAVYIWNIVDAYQLIQKDVPEQLLENSDVKKQDS